MAERTLGKVGVQVSCLTYVFIHYALLVAYVARSADIITGATGLPEWASAAAFSLSLGALCYFGRCETEAGPKAQRMVMQMCMHCRQSANTSVTFNPPCVHTATGCRLLYASALHICNVLDVCVLSTAQVLSVLPHDVGRGSQRVVGAVNGGLVVGVLSSFLFLLLVASNGIALEPLLRANFEAVPTSIPIIALSFVYQVHPHCPPSQAVTLSKHTRWTPHSFGVHPCLLASQPLTSFVY